MRPARKRQVDETAAAGSILSGLPIESRRDEGETHLSQLGSISQDRPCAGGRNVSGTYQGTFGSNLNLSPRYPRVIFALFLASFRVIFASETALLRVASALALPPAKSVHDSCRFNAA